MRSLVILLGFLVVVAAVPSKRTASERPALLNRLHREPPVPVQKSLRTVREEWITMDVDQFNASSTTWQMRYFSNDEHYQPGGPLFIYVGGEWTATPGWVQGGHMYDMARAMNGYVFYTEHRYYGSSHPVTDTSTWNLRFLHIDQALEDLAQFIIQKKATIPGASTSGVIMVGGSYSATMVTWFRQRYPHLVNGVWASSAPLFAKVDFTEYKEVVGWAMQHVGGDLCHSRLETAFAQMETDVASGNTANIQQHFNLCPDVDLTNQLDIWSFFSAISDELAGLVQYHWTGDIEGACSIITNPSYTPIEGLARWVRGGSSSCYDAGYQSFLNYLKDPAWNTPATDSAYRQWLFQTCNEYGWYQTSGSPNQPFGTSFPVEFYVQMCADLYENTFNAVNIEANVAGTNARNGGFNPVVTNVFSTHGELDPWRPMGVQTDINPSSPVVILIGHSHCSDLYSISGSDTVQMRETKERVTQSVRSWLGL